MADTIFALSTPPGVSGVAVVRISGPGAGEVLERLAGSLPPPRVASLRRLKTWDGAQIDEGLVLWFPAPHSFTGEDMVELQVHGSLAVIDFLSQTLLGMSCRPAEAGEFSRRALDAGKMDLIDAEALDQILQARDTASLKLAQGQVGAERSAKFARWHQDLRHLMATCEALIDFPEDDLPEALLADNQQRLTQLTQDVTALLDRSTLAQGLGQGLEILLVGPPNAGKSTLLNALAGYDRAIVTPQAGTTRDFVELDLKLGLFQVRVVDTAGLRESQDAIERVGIDRTRQRSSNAALILNLAAPGQEFVSIKHEGGQIWQIRTQTIGGPAGEAIAAGDPGQPGVSTLLDRIEAWLQETYGPVLQDLSFQRDRQVFHVKQMVEALEEAQNEALLPEMQAEKLRQAATALAYLGGSIHVEDVLDTLFSGFCIGK